MEFGRTARGVILAGVLGISASGCGLISPNEQHSPKPNVEMRDKPLTDCEKWARAAPAETTKLTEDLTAVAEQYSLSANGESSADPITPGLTFVAGCGKRVLASAGVGYMMYPDQVNKVHNSITNKVVSQAEVSPSQTEYDLASITKLVTTVGILMMQQDGLLNINDHVGKFVPEYSQGLKAEVTFKMLLQHRSGLVDPLYADIIDGSSNPNQVWHNLLDVPLTNPPGTSFMTETNYSNVGLDVAYIAATNAAHISPASFLLQNLFKPMGLDHSNYAPDVHNCPPTSPDLKYKVTLDCVPQDDLARALSMRAGNASLFMTADDLGNFLSMLSTNGIYKGHRYLTAASMALLKTPSNPDKTYGTGARMNGTGLYGKGFAMNAYGHTGWNGGAGVVNPNNRLFLGELMNGTDTKIAPSDPSYQMIAAMTTVLVKDTNALR